MKKRNVISIITTVVIIAGLLTGCRNSIAKNYGGTTEFNLPAGEKLMEVTWKDDDDIWYLTRPMREGEEAETYKFKERSNMGIVQGTVIIHEVKE